MRLIDADALKKDMCSTCDNRERCEDREQVCSEIANIDEQPTIEAEPVKHGTWTAKVHSRMKWIPKESDGITEDEIEVEDMTEQKCSICQRWTIKFTHHIELDFCPLCGARMDGDTE